MNFEQAIQLQNQAELDNLHLTMQKYFKAVQSTKGRFFSVTFTKKDGSTRKMICRTGVKIGVNGNGHSTAWTNVKVYDIQKRAWRSFNLDSLQEFKCGSTYYRTVDGLQGKWITNVKPSERIF
jgi:hypothetical protein